MTSDTDAFEQRLRALAPFPRGETFAKIHRKHYVLGCSQRRQELEKLEHETDVPATPRREFVFRKVVDGRSCNRYGSR